MWRTRNVEEERGERRKKEEAADHGGKGPRCRTHFLHLSHPSLGATLSSHAGDGDREADNVRGTDKDSEAAGAKHEAKMKC